MSMTEAVPDDAVGLQLYRANGNRLVACERITFSSLKDGVCTVLRRAAISGKVEVGGKLESHFADILDANMDVIESVALDSGSYSALKNKWMKCKILSK